MKPTVYIALQQFGKYDTRPVTILEEAGFSVRRNTLGRRLLREEMRDALQDAEAVLAGLEPYDAGVLEALPRLQCISRCGIGVDNIDLTTAARRGIRVLRTGDEVVEPVAQLTVGMLLALARRLPEQLADARSGRWHRRSGALLSEWTVGLVGFGRIGRTVARYLQPFGCRMLASDPRYALGDQVDGATICDLAALLSEADAVSIHADRPRNEGAIIGPNELHRMKRGGVLINTARGHLVDESALVGVLESQRLAGAALDVFDEEPYTGPLSAMPQVLCTAHVGSYTKRSRIDMELRCAQNVVDAVQHEMTPSDNVTTGAEA